MKKLPIFIMVLLVVTTFSARAIAAGRSYATIGSAVSVTSTGTVPIRPNPLLDDFSKGTIITCWGTTTSTTVKTGTTATISASYPLTPSVVFGASGRSLQLTYDVNATGSWAAYVTSLGDQSIADYKYLSFWVKGSTGGEYFKIELHHKNYDYTKAVGYNNDYKAEVYITDYLDGGVTTGWKKVVIPLDAFGNIADRSAIKELVITFDYAACDTNSSSKSGAVYIDNISFGKQFLGFVRIDHYGDKVGKDALGGNCGHTSGGGTIYGSYAYSDTSGQYDGFANGLVFNFTNVMDPRYYAYFSVIGGGDDGGIQQPRDFSSYQKFSFSVKSSSVNVTCLKVELHCPTNTNNYFHFLNGKKGQEAITTSWTDIRIPLSDFTTTGWKNQGTQISSSDLSKLGEVVITRDGFMSNPTWNDWDPGQYTGTFYIDNIQLEIDGYQPDTTAPISPSAPGITVNGNIVTLTSSAYTRFQDPSMECVYFSYTSGGTEHKVAFNYDTEDNNYSAVWDVSALPSGTYSMQAVAMDAAGNYTPSATTTTYTKS